MEETIIKKEDKLGYVKGWFSKQFGTLTLTPSTLSFMTKKGKPVFAIPVQSITSVNTSKGFGAGIDHLYVFCDEGGRERKIKIEHTSFAATITIGNLARLGASYFASWESAINDARFGKQKPGQGMDDLEKLADLKAKGIITDAEFAAKKKQILGV